MSDHKLTQEIVCDLLNYDKDTGVFTRRKDSYNSVVKAGEVAGFNALGYLLIQINGRQYRAHRIAWLYVYGKWPDGIIDHINGDKKDNRIANLRDADKSINALNTHAPNIDNTHGFRGVSFNKRFGKFYGRIVINNKCHFLGYHDTPEQAHKEYVKAKKELTNIFKAAA